MAELCLGPPDACGWAGSTRPLSVEGTNALMSMVNRSRGIRTERDRARRRGPRLGDPREGLADTPAHGRDLDPGRSGIEFRDDPRSQGSRSTGERRSSIVDDESAIRLVCRVNLDSAGFETIEAEGRGNRSSWHDASGRISSCSTSCSPASMGEVAAKLSPDARDPRHPDPVPHRARRSGTRFMATLSAVSATSRSRSTLQNSAATVTATSSVRRGERDKMRHEWKRLIE